jgi:serine/threonine protein kinase
MSPEQARGQSVDKRADIWAFGCVLYEMFTGQRAFAGATVTEVFAAILEREPDWQLWPQRHPRTSRDWLDVVWRRIRGNACATSPTLDSN